MFWYYTVSLLSPSSSSSHSLWQCVGCHKMNLFRFNCWQRIASVAAGCHTWIYMNSINFAACAFIFTGTFAHARTLVRSLTRTDTRALARHTSFHQSNKCLVFIDIDWFTRCISNCTSFTLPLPFKCHFRPFLLRHFFFFLANTAQKYVRTILFD